MRETGVVGDEKVDVSAFAPRRVDVGVASRCAVPRINSDNAVVAEGRGERKRDLGNGEAAAVAKRVGERRRTCARCRGEAM